MTDRSPKGLREIVGGLLRKIEKGPAQKGKAAMEAWKAATDEKTRENTNLAGFKNGKLTVIVKNSAWLYKLTMEKKNLLKRFNDSYTGKKKADGIRFRLGELGA